ncbi:transposase [Cupriavidus basilensis]
MFENLGEMRSLPELVLADAGYGASTEFREQLTAMGFTYVVGVTGTVSLQIQAQAPMQAKELAMQLPTRRFRTLTWREGTNRACTRFAATRVHCASRAAAADGPPRMQANG